MIHRILVPLDGSARAESILPYVAVLAEVFDARVDLLHVVSGQGRGAFGGPCDPLAGRLAMAGRSRYLERVASELRHDGHEVRTLVEEGGAAEVIVGTIRRGEYDLVALTPHGTGDDPHLTMGCTAVGVILNAQCSVLLVPPVSSRRGGARDPIGPLRVLAPVDCSPRNDWSLRVAASIARGTEGRLKVLHVLDRPDLVTRMPRSGAVTTLTGQFIDVNRDEVNRYLAQAVEALGGPDLDIETEVHEPSSAGPVDVVRRECRADRNDLVVLSAHGNGRTDGWPFGGTATKLLFNADRPVLLLQDVMIARDAWPSKPVRAERESSASPSRTTG